MMMDAQPDHVPEQEQEQLLLQCPCGSGPCAVRTSRTPKNPNRRFYKCQVCGFFKWCDDMGQGQGQSSQSPPSPLKKKKADQPTMICSCKAGPCIVLIMHQGPNKGRKYYACSIKKGYGACNHFEWVDGPVNPPEPENQTLPPPYESKKDLLATPAEPKQILPPYESVKDLFATPEPKQTLSPYESVKDLFSENDMATIEFWCKDQNENDPNYTTAALAVSTDNNNETRKELSPGKRGPPQLSSTSTSTVGEISFSPMKRLNIDDAVEKCLTCGAIGGQCIECPILAGFKDDDFADGNVNVLDGGNNSNFANISPVERPSVQNMNPSPSLTPNLSSSSFKRSGILF